MTNKQMRYSAPDICWEVMSVDSVLCASGDLPDYEPITDFNW